MKTNNLKSLLLGIITLALLGTSCQKDEHWTPAENGAKIEMLTPTAVIFETTEEIRTVTDTATMRGKMISMQNLSPSVAEFKINGKTYKLGAVNNKN